MLDEIGSPSVGAAVFSGLDAQHDVAVGEDGRNGVDSARERLSQ